MQVKSSDITGISRTKQISTARQIAIFLSKKYTNKTLIEIGDKFSKRNHTTIISSINKIEKMILDDANIKKIIEKLEREIEENKF